MYLILYYIYVRHSLANMTNFHHFHDEVDLRLSFVYSEGDFAPSLPHSLVVTHVMNQWQELISRRLEDVSRCMAFLGHLTPIGALPKGAHEYSWLTYFFFILMIKTQYRGHYPPSTDGLDSTRLSVDGA